MRDTLGGKTLQMLALFQEKCAGIPTRIGDNRNKGNGS